MSILFYIGLLFITLFWITDILALMICIVREDHLIVESLLFKSKFMFFTIEILRSVSVGVFLYHTIITLFFNN